MVPPKLSSGLNIIVVLILKVPICYLSATVKSKGHLVSGKMVLDSW